MNDVISGRQEDSDSSAENVYENANIFHDNYRQSRQSPVYSSSSEIPRRSKRPVERPPPPSQSDSPEDVEDDPVDRARRPRQEKPRKV